MKLNYRCPKGKFVPDSFSCGDTPEESKKNYESLQKEKSKSSTITSEKSNPTFGKQTSLPKSRIASSEETISYLTKSNDKLLATIKNSKDQEEIKKLQRIVNGNNKSIEYFKNKIKTSPQIDTTKVNDIANKVRSGKKITKEEYNTLKPHIEKVTNTPTTSISNTSDKTNTYKLSKEEKTIFDKFISNQEDRFKSPFYTNRGLNIHDMSNGVMSAYLIDSAMWNEKEYDVVKKVALASVTTPFDKMRVDTAIWMTNNIINFKDKVGIWSRHDGKIIDAQKGKNNKKECIKAADEIENYLKDAPKYNAEVFRGIGNLDDKTFNDLLNAKELKWPVLSATSANEEIANQYATGTYGSGLGHDKNSIVFNIKKSKSGVYISDNGAFGSLEEVLVPKNTSYKVLGVKDKTYTKTYGKGKEKTFKIKVMELEEI